MGLKAGKFEKLQKLVGSTMSVGGCECTERLMHLRCSCGELSFPEIPLAMMAPVSPAPRSRTGRLPRQVFTLGRPRRREPLPSCKVIRKRENRKEAFGKEEIFR